MKNPLPKITDLTPEQRRAATNYLAGGMEAIAEANRSVDARALMDRAIRFAVEMYPAEETK